MTLSWATKQGARGNGRVGAGMVGRKGVEEAGSMPVLADVTGCEIYSWGCPLADGSFVVGVNERYELEAVLATTN